MFTLEGEATCHVLPTPLSPTTSSFIFFGGILIICSFIYCIYCVLSVCFNYLINENY